MNKKQYLKSLEEIGWFDYPQNDRDQIINKINKSENNYHLDLHHFSFFIDDFRSIEDYKSFMKELKEIGGIAFQSAEIRTNEDENSISLKVHMGKKEFEMNFDLDEFTIIPQIEENFNDLFANFEIDSRLFWLPLESEIFFYALIPFELYKKATIKDMIPME
ncbi:hypothetical protein GCM10022393_26800 [Aquimarina addita]|uniref:Uncharacterized protein n=1 Tax=Aquimarina addita TaxID=870485 RepID=A0ABP6ULJ8_9FLAO